MEILQKKRNSLKEQKLTEIQCFQFENSANSIISNNRIPIILLIVLRLVSSAICPKFQVFLILLRYFKMKNFQEIISFKTKIKLSTDHSKFYKFSIFIERVNQTQI